MSAPNRPASSLPASAVRLGCVVAAVALNLGVIGWLAGPLPVPPMRHLLLARLVDAASAPPAPASTGAGRATQAELPRATDSPFQAKPATSAAHHKPMPRHRDKLSLPAAPPSPPSAEAPQPVTPNHFYSFNEVDVPAAPVADWELDAATLDAARTARIVFDLFVSEDGSVIECTIVEPADLDIALRSALEARLRSTALLPAIRTGQPVYSVRRIELFVS